MREFDQEIAELKGRVAVVSFATPDHLKQFAERLGHPYLWLADPRRVSYMHLGLRRRIWRPEQIDLAQMGGDFVFDRDGDLTLTYVSTSSDDRPSAQTLMLAFRRAAEL